MSETKTFEKPGFSLSNRLTFSAIVEAALMEDLVHGDLTTDNLPALALMQQTATLRVREACVISGLAVARQVFERVDPSLCIHFEVAEGQKLSSAGRIGTIQGAMASILKAERTALNFLQHLSGIATETRRYVDAVAGTSTRIAHTRKTTPGLRLLEQQAVLHGGGSAHRFHLGSAAMLKDNHLQALSKTEPHGLSAAICQLRQRLSHTVKIEVEADTLDQARQAAEAGADIILLDNMSLIQLREALALIRHHAPHTVITEASGGISLETVRAYAETGVDVISTSKITLGVPAIDIGLDLDR